MDRVDVVVVGAGAAGLACAQELTSAGRQVVVLEARDRVGGRVRTLRMPTGEIVELGAQIVHPTRDDTLDQIVRSAQVRTTPMPTGADLVVVGNGERLDAASLSRYRPPAPWVVEQQLGIAFPGTGTVFEAIADLPGDRRVLATAWLDQVVGGDCRTLDLQGVVSAREARRHGQETVVADGFDHITDALAVGLDIRLTSPVETVRWSEDGVDVDGPDKITARAAVVTVPPSVVRAGGLRFAPQLPSAKCDALRPLASSDALVVVLTTTAAARRSTWVLLGDEPGGLWRTTTGSAVVAGHIKGPAADSARRERWTIEHATQTASAVDPDLGAVTAVEVCDWGADPCARGAYCVPVAGADQASRRWADPLAGVLYFAGEASAGSHLRGLVQGALASGRRAAREVLERSTHG